MVVTEIRTSTSLEIKSELTGHGDILNSRINFKILVSNLKYVKRITRQQAHVVAQKEKERRKNKNKNGVSGSRTVNESDSSDSSDSSDDGFDMTDSSDEECDEKFI